MRKYWSIIMTILLLLVTANSYATTFWGQVVNSSGVRIPYPTIIVVDPNAGPIDQVTGNADGYYQWTRSFCGYKNLIATAGGYQNKTKKAYDGTCPDCFVPRDDTKTCSTAAVRINFTLLNGNSDVDADGVLDDADNCPTTPNGPQMGTCRSGSKRGRACSNQLGCGCATKPFPCDIWQTDANGNDVGDVCEYEGSSLLTEEDDNSHAFMTKENIDFSLLPYWRSIIFSLYNFYHYDSFDDMIEGVLNGPDMLCSTCPTHDFDGNGIADEREGGLPDGLTWDDYYQGYMSAVECCMEKWNKE